MRLPVSLLLCQVGKTVLVLGLNFISVTSWRARLAAFLWTSLSVWDAQPSIGSCRLGSLWQPAPLCYCCGCAAPQDPATSSKRSCCSSPGSRGVRVCISGPRLHRGRAEESLQRPLSPILHWGSSWCCWSWTECCVCGGGGGPVSGGCGSCLPCPVRDPVGGWGGQWRLGRRQRVLGPCRASGEVLCPVPSSAGSPKRSVGSTRAAACCPGDVFSSPLDFARPTQAIYGPGFCC